MTIGGPEALSAMLVAVATLWAAWRWVSPSRKDARAILRSALFFAWSVLVAEMASRLSQGAPLDASIPPLDGVVTASLTFGAVALVMRQLTGTMRTIFGGLGVALVVSVEWLVLEGHLTGALHFTAYVLAVRVTCAWLGLALLDAMLERRHAVARAALHAVAFGSTIGLLAPLAVLWTVGRTVTWPSWSPARAVLVVSLVTGSIALGTAAARAFVRAGGTPDPLDAPPRLVTDGVYARTRHPLQVAEALWLIATAVTFWDAWVLGYAVVSIVSLVGPLRLLEEALLEHRFGKDAVAYRRQTPAFLRVTSPRAVAVPPPPRTQAAR
jgi:protein-S-isoprenylcysteine O-methyltransferase Ste14